MNRPSHTRTLWAMLVIALAATAAYGLWRRGILPNLSPKNFGTVEPGQIYRSGELTPEAFRKVITQHGIKTVLDLGAHQPDSASETRERRTLQALGVTRYQVRLEGDSTGNPNYYVQALRLMSDPSKRPILVHCNAGAERTSCAVILYRHIVEGKAIDDVYHEAFAHRHSDERNPELRRMLTDWSGRIGAAFRAGGLITGPGAEPVPDLTPTDPAPPARP